MRKLVASAFSVSVMALVFMSTSFDNAAFEANTVSNVVDPSLEMEMGFDGRNSTSGTLSVNGISATGTQSFSISSGGGTGSFSSSTTTETGTFSSSSSTFGSSTSGRTSSRSSSSFSSSSSSRRTTTTGGFALISGSGESCDYITSTHIKSMIGCS